MRLRHRGLRSGGLLFMVSSVLEKLGRTQTRCATRMLGGEFCQVVDIVVDYYPEIFGNIVFGYLLD